MSEEIKFLGEEGTQALINKCKETFATKSEVSNGPSVVIQATEPTEKINGMLWLDEEGLEGSSYVYIDSQDSYYETTEPTNVGAGTLWVSEE